MNVFRKWAGPNEACSQQGFWLAIGYTDFFFKSCFGRSCHHSFIVLTGDKMCECRKWQYVLFKRHPTKYCFWPKYGKVVLRVMHNFTPWHFAVSSAFCGSHFVTAPATHYQNSHRLGMPVLQLIPPPKLYSCITSNIAYPAQRLVCRPTANSLSTRPCESHSCQAWNIDGSTQSLIAWIKMWV